MFLRHGGAEADVERLKLQATGISMLCLTHFCTFDVCLCLAFGIGDVWLREEEDGDVVAVAAVGHMCKQDAALTHCGLSCGIFHTFNRILFSMEHC